MIKDFFTIECPGCSNKMDIKIKEVVDVKENPELKNEIIEGDFFRHKCPKCGDEIIVEYPITYIDPDKKLNIYMEPGYGKDVLENLNSLDLPEELIDKESVFRLVPNGLSLAEKILIAEKNRDDRILELYKFIIWKDVLKEWPELKEGDLIYVFDKEQEYFTVWPSDNGKGEKMSIPINLEFYENLADKYMDFLKIPAGKYEVVDKPWISKWFSS